MSAPKRSPQEWGRIGANRRWGPPRIVHIGDLTAEQRRLVLAMVNAAKATAAREKAEAA